MGKLKNKVAVVLGASSINGLGGVIAKKYYDEGAKLVVSGRRQEPLNQIASELDWLAQTCDITKDGDVEKLFQAAKDKYGKVDIAVNTTGIYEPGNLNDLTRDHLRKYSEISFIGSVIFIREAAKLKSGSSEPGRVIAGSITMKQAEAIAKEKMKDLNAFDIKEATKIICGSARSMGIEVKE